MSRLLAIVVGILITQVALARPSDYDAMAPVELPQNFNWTDISETPFKKKPNYNDLYLNVEDLLDYNPACKSLVSKISGMTRSHGNEAARGYSWGIPESINALLRKNLNSPCFQDMAKAYAISSLNILAPNRFSYTIWPRSEYVKNQPEYYDRYPVLRDRKEKGEYYAELNRYTGGSYSKNSPGKIVGSNIILSLLAVKIANMGKLGFMQPISAGQSGADRKILGSFDCKTGGIWLDPFQAPFDLGATFVHEMDHLFRDKIDSKLLAGLNLRDYLVLDETLAAVHASYYQTEIRRDMYGMLKMRETGEELESVKNLLQSDLRFYNKDGYVFGLAFGFQNPLAVGFAGYYDYFQFLALNFFNYGHVDPQNLAQFSEGLIYSSMGTYRPRGYYAREIYKLMGKAYFRGAVLSNEELQSFNRSSLDSTIDPLAEALGKPLIFRAKINGKEKISQSGFIHLLSELEKSYSNVSNHCKEFENAVRTSALEDYVGSSISITPIETAPPTNGRPGQDGVKPAGQDGVKPGQDGVKPGQDGVKPAGQDGVKPGQDGVKPGQDGVKPGQDGVKPMTPMKPSRELRPCIDLYDLL